MKQLILSPLSDANAAAACWGLRASGYEPIWAASGSLSDAAIGSVSLSLEDGGEWRSGSPLSAPELSAVWYRWPRHPKLFPDAHPADQTFLAGEWRSFEENFYAVSAGMLDALWVNPPDAAKLTENKAVQLRAARACGLLCPETLISNDPEVIRSFLTRHDMAIYKPFIPHGWKNVDSGQLYQTPATLITDPSEIEDSAFSLCPGIFQRYIDKLADIRVTVIGDKMFSARISDRSGGAFVDWRPAGISDEKIRAEVITLPCDLEKKIRALMVRLGIVYGAIDLVQSKQGEWYFLEVNQVGQFLFVERWLPELPLLAAMCAMLGQGRRDYSLDAVAPVSLSSFLESDDHQAWQERLRTQRPSSRSVDSGISLEGGAGDDAQSKMA